MAVSECGGSVLASILEANELDKISETARNKLECTLCSKEAIADGLKTEIQKFRIDYEQRYFELEKKLIAAKGRFQSEASSASHLKKENVEFEKQVKDLTEELKEVTSSRDKIEITHQQVCRSNDHLETEKQDLLDALERKNVELERLNADWKNLTEKLATANQQKVEAQVKLDEIQSHDMSAKYREKRLEQEKQLLASQNEWLNTELKTKTNDLLAVKKEKSEMVLGLQAKVTSMTDEVQHLTDLNESLKKTNSDQTKKIESLIQKIKENSDAQAQSEELFHNEIQSQSKLASLYKASSEESEGKVKELIRAVEELQKLLKQATEAHTNLENKISEIEKAKDEQEYELQTKLNTLTRELEDANDLLAAAKKKRLPPLSEEELSNLSPTAAAASKFLKPGMTLTEIYSEYVKSTETLQQTTEENQRLNHYLDQILEEIEEKAPVLQKQREDYENSLQTTEMLSIKLDKALLECEQLRIATDDSERKASQMMRENRRLQQQAGDLSRQIRALLKETAEANGTHVTDTDGTVSSSDISSSSQVISEHLVSFRNITELQQQNERLLAVVRELSEKKEKEERETIESKTSELKLQLDKAVQELSEMRDTRSRQTQMVESIVRQRDMYRVLLAQTGTPPPVSVSDASVSVPTPSATTAAQKSPGLPQKTRQSSDDTAAALKQLKEEFDTYRNEKNENEKLLNEQLETLRTQASDFRVQNAKLASQLDFASERYKILQGNIDGYKKEIAGLRDKAQKHSTEAIKLQQTINSLTQDQLAFQERLSRAEVSCENLRAERDMLKGVEVRLSQEKDALMREHQGQNLLLANLETIKNNLERSEFEEKARMTNKIESLDREISTLKGKLEAESKNQQASNKSWEKQLEEAHGQWKKEMASHQGTREKLANATADLNSIKEQCSTAEAQLAAAQIKLDQALKNGSGGEAPGKTDEFKGLAAKLRQSEEELKRVKEQLQNSKTAAERFKGMSAAFEQSCKEQNDASKTFKETMERRNQEVVEANQKLEEKILELEKEKAEMNLQSTQLQELVNQQTSELRKKLSQAQTQLQEALEKSSVAQSREEAARQDCQSQAQLAKECQDKYEREFLLHAADLQQLVTVKEQLEGYNSKLSEAQEAGRKAEDALNASKISWDEQLRIQKEEVSSLQSRCQDVEKQNAVLHEQLEVLSSKFVNEQEKDAADAVNMSFSEDKSVEQLLEVIRFVRREKEIAETRFEVVQAESVRFKLNCSLFERRVEETQKALTDERERSQVAAQTRAQHEDLVSKLEKLNVLTDSNKLLREEKEKLEQQLQCMEAKINKLESDIAPLQETNRELIVQKYTLSAEKTSLTNEVTRWKERTNNLIEKSNKADPEEQKKLTEERDNNRKTIKTLTEEQFRNKAEISRLNSQLTSSRSEISRMNLTHSNAQSQHKLELAKVNEALNASKKTVEEKIKDVEEQKKTINQVRKIGRKYKSQFDELKLQFDTLQAKVKEDEKQQAAATPQVGPETESKLKTLEEQVKTLTEETTQMKEENEKMKTQLTEKDEKEEKFKNALQGTRKRMTTLSSKSKNSVGLIYSTHSVKSLDDIDELKGQVQASEILSAEQDRQSNKAKEEYQIQRRKLEHQLKEANEQQMKLKNELAQQRQKAQKDLEDVQQKCQEQQRIINDQQKQLQTQQQQQQVLVASERPSTTREEPPPTANIKPMATPSPTTAKPSPTSSTLRATASIRPIAKTASSVSSPSVTPTPMATVMPQTQEPSSTPSQPPPQPESSENELSTMTNVVTATPVWVVPPTQLAPPVAIAEPVMESQPLAEEPSTSQGYEPETSGGCEACVQAESTSVATIEPSTSTRPSTEPTPSAVAMKRPRDDDDNESEAVPTERESTPPLEKKQKVQKQGEASPEPSKQSDQPKEEPVPEDSKEAQALPQEVVQPREDPRREKQPQRVTQQQVEQQREAVQQEANQQDGQQYKPPPCVNNDDDEVQFVDSEGDDDAGIGIALGDEEREDSDVIVLESEDDEEVFEGQQRKDEEDDDEDEDYEEYEDEFEETDMDEIDEEEEGMDRGDEEEDDDDPMEDDTNEVVEIIDEDDDDDVMETHQDSSRSSSQQHVSPSLLGVVPPEQSQSSAPLHHRTERLPSIGRPSLFYATGVPFEDVGDDRLVPSTPTLFVPRSDGGFAEVINSPLLQASRFHFGPPGEAETTRPGLAQLETQERLGMDETRINPLLGDDDGGRSVPTTPLLVHAPVSIASNSVSESSDIVPSISVPVTVVSTSQVTTGGDEPDTDPRDQARLLQGAVETRQAASSQSPASTQELEIVEAGGSGEATAAARAEDIGPSSSTNNGGEKEAKEAPSTSGQAAESSTEQGGEAKSKPKPIVWNTGNQAQSSGHPTQSSASVRPAQPRPQSAVRGRRPIQRNQRGGRGRFQPGRGRGGNM
ncbi:nucleoprotein TPR-like [Anneissia japonica]|uniref:nucleoprotein TPR-like n=1 Tax=Anneissia japonica TaxID=1529436 RepID=UPI0014259065|nr:nucleoprotein TPR-like [Anneissia japonica]